MINLLIALTIFFSHSAFGRGGTGGTSGGNPKPVNAVYFNQDPARAQKLTEAVNLLRERLGKSCFPADYNKAMLAEMDFLVDTNELYYFPETVLLGSDRYDGDYSERQRKNGDYEFFHVGAFTKKVKGKPIFFTRDSDKYDVEELAMTFAQDLNDHVLQWKNEEYLNLVGAMAMGREKCDPLDDDVRDVFRQFPEKASDFDKRYQAFIAHLKSATNKRGITAFGTYKEMKMENIVQIPFGVRFKLKALRHWDGKWVERPVKGSPELEIILSPFKEPPNKYFPNGEQLTGGIVRDVKTGTIITELLYGREKDDINMDSFCGYREWDENDGIRNVFGFTTPHPDRAEPCKVLREKNQFVLTMNVSNADRCKKESSKDHFNQFKTVDDLEKEPTCEYTKPLEFTKEDFERIVGNRSPKQFAEELERKNTAHYAERFSLKENQVKWFSKEVLGGSVRSLPEFISIVKDEKGEVYSVAVHMRGFYIDAKEDEDPEDEDDVAYQCFFQGPLKGKCSRRFYDD